jgi:hypothetical protein
MGNSSAYNEYMENTKNTKTTFTAILPNGEIITRNSKRTYTHFYAIMKNENGRRDGLVISEGWHFGGFAGSKALAEKGASAMGKMFDWVVLEVEGE